MTASRVSLRVIGFLLAALVGVAAARAESPELYDLTQRESSDARLLSLGASVKTSLDSMLERYAAEIAAAPFDVVLRIDRCRFLEGASYEYEYAEWVEEVYELAEACVAELEADFPEHPERHLFAIERLYGQERIDRTGELIDVATSPGWTPVQRARLFAFYAQALAGAEDSRAADFARRALEQDPRADVRLILARDLVEKGENAEVVRILKSPFDHHDPDDARYTVEKMRLLAQAGDVGAVVELHEKLHAGDGYYDSSAVIDVLLAAGRTDLARVELERYAERAYSGDAKRRRFYFEYEHGTPADSFAAYEALRDDGWQQDPLGILRLSLQVRDRGLPVSPRDWLGLVGFLLAAAALAFACAVPIGLVHYRGLARRVHTNAAYPLDGWRLRDAWRASFLFGLASLVAAYAVGPFDIAIAQQGFWTAEIPGPRWARLMVVQSALALAFLIPIAARGKRVEPRWWSNDGVLRRWLAIAVVCAVALRVPLFAALADGGDNVREAFLETQMWQLLENVRSEFGIATTLWLIVLFAPVVEELLFRGVMLRAFNAHLKFWSANLLQALLFASAHMDPQAFGYLAVTGLVLGWLRRRSGGLAAPIAMHAVFNGLAAVVAYS